MQSDRKSDNKIVVLENIMEKMLRKRPDIRERVDPQELKVLLQCP